MKKFIPLSLPAVGFREALAVGRAVKSGWLTQFGEEVEVMEKNISNHYSERFKNALSVTSTSNGTTALHLALLSLGLAEGDEVIIPNLCYVAVPNSILYCSAIPVSVDVDLETWNINQLRIADAVSAKTKAIILVDNYGRQSTLNEIRNLIPDDVAIIQDAAESFPGILKPFEKNESDLVTISCYANKILTAGEGGAVIGKPFLIDRIKTLKNQSQNPNRKFSHTDVGYNYRLTNMQAALFNIQWRKRESLLRERLDIFNHYFSELEVSNIEWKTNYTENSTPWLFTISAKTKSGDMRGIIDHLRRDGIESRPGFTTVSESGFLKNRVKIHGSVQNSEYLSRTLISLPTFPGLKRRDIKRIVGSLEMAIKNDA
jgi:perosamine synthetase